MLCLLIGFVLFMKKPPVPTPPKAELKITAEYNKSGAYEQNEHGDIVL